RSAFRLSSICVCPNAGDDANRHSPHTADATRALLDRYVTTAIGSLPSRVSPTREEIEERFQPPLERAPVHGPGHHRVLERRPGQIEDRDLIPRRPPGPLAGHDLTRLGVHRHRRVPGHVLHLPSLSDDAPAHPPPTPRTRERRLQLRLPRAVRPCRSPRNDR